jgi:hypothetical protein
MADEPKKEDKTIKDHALALKDIMGDRYEDFVKKLNDMADDPKFVAAIQAGMKDGRENDEKIKFNEMDVLVRDLVPTQHEIDVTQSLSWQLSGKAPEQLKKILEGGPVTIKSPIIILNKKYIIDGHHRWSQAYAMNDHVKISALNMTSNKGPETILKAVQLAIAAVIKKVPVAVVEGINLLKAGEKDIKKYVEENISDVTLDALVDAKKIEEKDKGKAADYIWTNVESMQKGSQPVPGAPPRGVMPQTDQAEGWEKVLKTGEINFKKPFVPVKESNNFKMEFNLNEAEQFVSGKISGKVLNFSDFVFENRVDEAETVAGYGQQPFYFAINGDNNNYFFKIQDGKDLHGFVVSIGKFAKFAKPTEQKLEYAVLSITTLKDADLDQAVLDKGKFTTNTETIVSAEGLLGKLLDHMSLVIEDYLQKNPKVTTFYDEFQLIFQAPDYDNKFSVSLAKWPGGNDTWHLQTMEPGKLNVIKK